MFFSDSNISILSRLDPLDTDQRSQADKAVDKKDVSQGFR